MTERWAILKLVQGPELTLTSAIILVRWLMVLVILGAIAWLVAGRLRERRTASR